MLSLICTHLYMWLAQFLIGCHVPLVGAQGYFLFPSLSGAWYQYSSPARREDNESENYLGLYSHYCLAHSLVGGPLPYDK